METDGSGERNINFDESLFLKIVEEADGSLTDIYERIRKRGELIDDLSLLGVRYPADPADQTSPANGR